MSTSTFEMARAYDVRGLRAFARDMRANWEEAVREVEGRPDAVQQSVALMTTKAATGLEWLVVTPENTVGPPTAYAGNPHDRRSDRFSTDRLGVTPVGHADIQSWVVAEQNRERVRLWYVAATRARDLLVLPRHSPDLAANSWGQIVDLGLASLPALDPAALADQMAEPPERADNGQTRDVFAAEAMRIVEAERKIAWRRPSRDEGETSNVALEPVVFVGSATAEEAAEWPILEVAGGATRGTILHKLMEEVLTGETQDDNDSLLARAAELLSQLGIEPSSDPWRGIAPPELAVSVLRTLALPEIAALRPRLVPERTVFAANAVDGSEVLVSGIADAVALSVDGQIEAVIDWKSDHQPSAKVLEHYRAQLQAYCDSTSAGRGMLVFMSIGKALMISR